LQFTKAKPSACVVESSTQILGTRLRGAKWLDRLPAHAACALIHGGSLFVTDRIVVSSEMLIQTNEMESVSNYSAS
jgi:hypothetical protein